MNRNQVRKSFIESGIDISSLKTDDIKQLRDFINDKLNAENSYFRCINKIKECKSGELVFALYCKSDYFDERECVSFYRNSKFPIGFAGWADDESVAPILYSFIEWLDTIKNKLCATK